MSAAVIERLRALERKATGGPWLQSHCPEKNGMYSTRVYDGAGQDIATLAWHSVPVDGGERTDRAENAALIADARNLLPALLDCAEALERLRVAQRAYMADRGNDALGKKVGEAAIVADAALAALERSGK